MASAERAEITRARAACNWGFAQHQVGWRLAGFAEPTPIDLRLLGARRLLGFGLQRIHERRFSDPDVGLVVPPVNGHQGITLGKKAARAETGLDGHDLAPDLGDQGALRSRSNRAEAADLNSIVLRLKGKRLNHRLRPLRWPAAVQSRRIEQQQSTKSRQDDQNQQRGKTSNHRSESAAQREQQGHAVLQQLVAQLNDGGLGIKGAPLGLQDRSIANQPTLVLVERQG